MTDAERLREIAETTELELMRKPLLYTDVAMAGTEKATQFCRDDMWAVSTKDIVDLRDAIRSIADRLEKRESEEVRGPDSHRPVETPDVRDAVSPERGAAKSDALRFPCRCSCNPACGCECHKRLPAAVRKVCEKMRAEKFNEPGTPMWIRAQVMDWVAALERAMEGSPAGTQDMKPADTSTREG